MTRLYDLPATICGFIRETCEPDGDYYTIVLNSRLTYERLRETYSHEFSHIEYDDFHSERSVAEIESIRHSK